MKYYLLLNGETKGPLALEMVHEMLTAGMIENTTLMAQEGGSDWQPVAEVLAGAAAPKNGIEFNCPHCGIAISAETGFAGAAAKCPSCGQGMIVPTIRRMAPRAADARSLLQTMRARQRSNKTKKAITAAILGVAIMTSVIFGVIHYRGWRVWKPNANRNNGPSHSDSALSKQEKASQEDLMNPTAAAAQLSLALKYHKGDGVPKDPAQAMKWYRKSADQGFAKAQFALGGCYITGLGSNKDKDPKEAAKWFRKAADQGLDDAQVMLASLYGNGSGVPKNLVESARWYGKAAEQGNALAQYCLGKYYAAGTGVQEDSKEAAKWFRKAADQGYSEAQYMLGAWYALGTGVREDLAQSEKWLRKAADQGNSEAQLGLGALYSESTYEHHNMIISYMWCDLAAASNIANVRTTAANLLRWLESEMSQEDIAEAKKLSRERKGGIISNKDSRSVSRGADDSPIKKGSKAENMGSSAAKNKSPLEFEFDRAVSEISEVYPEMSKKDLIQKLEAISGLSINTVENAREANKMVQKLKASANMAGEPMRKFFDMVIRKNAEHEKSLKRGLGME